MRRMGSRDLIYSWLGRQAYEPLWQMLSARAGAVGKGADEEIVFCCEHEAVYTTGRRGVDNRLEELLPAAVVKSDRGGEMTFHGPGQLMLYPIIHLKNRQLGVKQYVHLLEVSCIALLRELGITAESRCGFPGVWTAEGKIAALGVRVSGGVAYHGMALNVDVDEKWFAAINPCGLQSKVVSLSSFIEPLALPELASRWSDHFNRLMSQ
ncbi:lipoyl(octanoyl) transferase LipB [Mariprofundus sp. NF]|nr:lipoyl(octanoyl) transferase LipB [Mariprofundus sp. NF]